MAAAAQVDPEYLLPPHGREDAIPAARWGRKAAGLVVATLMLATVVLKSGVKKSDALVPVVAPAALTDDDNVLQVLQQYPSPTTIEAANDMLAALPHHEAEEAVLAHLKPHAEELFQDFLAAYGSTAPEFHIEPTRPRPPTAPRQSFASKEERAHRLKIFEDSLAIVIKLNKASRLNDHDVNRAVFGINPYSDWTWEEFSAMLGGELSWSEDELNATDRYSGTADELNATSRYSNKAAQVGLSARCDVNYAARFPHLFAVRSQGACGSCWVHGATEEIRAVHALQTGYDVGPLSVEFILDCEDDVQNHHCGKSQGGCCGGVISMVYRYVKSVGGIPTKDDYGPYFGEHNPGQDFPCKKGVRKAVAIDNWVETRNEVDMATIMCRDGPMAVYVYVNQAFGHYVGGVLKRGACYGPRTNHAVQAVGIDTALNAFIIRNSWGVGWGVSPYRPYSGRGRGGKGFILLEFGASTCNIAQNPASIPIETRSV